MTLWGGGIGKKPQQPGKGFLAEEPEGHPVLCQNAKGEARSPWRAPATSHVGPCSVFDR